MYRGDAQGNPTGTVLCAATVIGASFRERVQAASEAGFEAISLFPEQYLNARQREKLSPADMRLLLQDHGLHLATVDPLLDWYGHEPSRAEQLLYEMAEALEAPALNAAPAFAPDLPPEELATHFSRLCRRAAEQGLRVDLEVLPWSRIANYPQAFEILQLADTPNSGITLDCLHFYRGGDSVQSLAKYSPQQLSRISNIQLCDIAAQPEKLGLRDTLAAGRIMLETGRNGLRVMGPGALLASNRRAYTGREDASTLMQEATCNRLLPGQGDIPLQSLFQFLQEQGVTPQVGLEVFSLRLNRLPALQAAQNCMDSWRRLHQTL